MRILQNGNVGIGTTNPTAKLFIGQSNDALVDKTSFLINNSDQSQTKPIFKIESYDNEANFNVLELTNENLITDFVVQSQGNVGIGTATPEARLHVHGSSVTNSKTLLIDGFGASQGYGIFMQPNNNDIGMHYVTFANNTGSVIGSISRGVLSGISYNTNSDYRLKENVAELDAEMAVKKVMAARPVSYTWKSDGSADVGFIAHELMEAGFVNAVAGEKDAVDADGKIVPQGVDYGRITPEIMKVVQYLVKENEKLRAEIEASGLLIIDLKEQQKQIEALKNEVELLKNK
jgi:hypothetical protein